MIIIALVSCIKWCRLKLTMSIYIGCIIGLWNHTLRGKPAVQREPWWSCVRQWLLLTISMEWTCRPHDNGSSLADKGSALLKYLVWVYALPSRAVIVLVTMQAAQSIIRKKPSVGKKKIDIKRETFLRVMATELLSRRKKDIVFLFFERKLIFQLKFTFSFTTFNKLHIYQNLTWTYAVLCIYNCVWM